MTITEAQLQILRHMLGIDVRDVQHPNEYRDYFCANPGDADLHALAAMGLVRLYAVRDGYEWFTTTDDGKAAARASQQARLLPKRARIDWPDQCPICGGDVTLTTTHPQDDGQAAYDGDRWRCEDGHEGTVHVDEDGPAELVEPTHTELRSI